MKQMTYCKFDILFSFTFCWFTKLICHKCGYSQCWDFPLNPFQASKNADCRKKYNNKCRHVFSSLQIPFDSCALRSIRFISIGMQTTFALQASAFACSAASGAGFFRHGIRLITFIIFPPFSFTFALLCGTIIIRLFIPCCIGMLIL